MDNSFYSRRIEEDSAVSFGRESNYSKLDNMESMDMDAKLIQSSKQRFLARNWKWIYAGAGILAGCILTAGICYMFFTLGKGKSHRNIQSNGNILRHLMFFVILVRFDLNHYPFVRIYIVFIYSFWLRRTYHIIGIIHNLYSSYSSDAVGVVIVWEIGLQLHMQSVHITTNVVSSNPA